MLNLLLLSFIIFPGLLYFLVGFIYHYYRNKTYLNIAVESIIIGLIFGFFIRVDGVGWAEWTLTSILIIVSSGVLALKIRMFSSSKLSKSDGRDDKRDYRVDTDKINDNTDDKHEEDENTEDKRDYEVDFGKIKDKLDDKPEKDESVEDKFSKYPIRRSNRFKPFKETIPFTPAEEIKIYPYNIKKPFKSFKRISVRSDNALESKTAAMDNVNGKLKQKASNLGANAVINVVYKQGIFALFRGIRGYGQAVYIKDMENVEKTYPPGTVFYMIMGFFWLIMGLLGYFDYRQFYQFYIPFGLFMIIYGVFIRRGYINKTFFLALAGIITFFGLQLLRYILKNGIQLYNLDFYFGAGFFAMLLISFVYSYKRRKNDPNLLWKDQWGFK